MDTHRPEGSRRSGSGSAFEQAAERLLVNSLMLYLVAVAAQRVWVLLNSDVAHLIRRVH